VDKGDGNGYVNIVGATNSTYIITEIGKYKYIGTDANSCPIELCCPYEVIPGISTYSLCPNESYTVVAQSGLSTVQWQVDKGDGNGYVNIAGATNSTYVITEIGKYKYVGTAANSCPIELCCPYEVIAGTNCTQSCPTTTYPLCANESYTVVAQSGLSMVQWQVDKGDGNGYVNIAGATNSTYVITEIGKYKYVGIDANNACVSLCCPFEITDCCKDTTYFICDGESYTLSAVGNLTMIQWQVNTGAGYQDINGATNSSYTATTSGTYRYVAQDANGCTVIQCCPYKLQTVLSPNFTLSLVPTCKGELDNVLISNMGNTQLSLIKIDNGIFENYPQSSVLSGLSIGLHTVTIQNIYGCTDSQQITINTPLSKPCLSVLVTRK
jgi:hypothetical protein